MIVYIIRSIISSIVLLLALYGLYDTITEWRGGTWQNRSASLLALGIIIVAFLLIQPYF